MKILLVAINAKYVHTNLAYLYLQRVSSSQVRPQILEFTIDQSPYDILSEISKNQPGVIAFSVYIWNSRIIKELLSDIRKILPNTTIVVGGPEVTYNKEGWLNSCSSIDFLVCGGGEAFWKKFTAQTEDGQLFFYNQRGIHDKASPVIWDEPNVPLATIPFPYDETSIHQLKNRIIYYETSRGCPYECTFCLSSAHKGVEYRDLVNVNGEIDFFIRNSVKIVKFIDRTFNSDRIRGRAIWEKILATNTGTQFHFEINPVLLSDEDIQLLKSVPKGWFQFEIGIQSTNKKTLKEIHRPANTDHIFDKIHDLLSNTNIDIHLDLISGLPYEDYSLFKDSFSKVYKLKPHTFQPGMLKVLAGTKMAYKAQEYELEFQTEPPYRILKNRWISFNELNRLHNIEHLVNNLYNSHKFVHTLDYLVEITGDPFNLFEQLELFWERQNISHWLKNWERTALCLVDYVSQHHPHKLQCLYDCLRWDLCYYAKGKHYPDFLQSAEIGELNNQWRLFTRIADQAFWEENKVSRNICKQSILFFPLSNEYCQRNGLSKSNCLVVYRELDGYYKSLVIPVNLIASRSI